MDKKEVQKRVLLDNKPLDLDSFLWDEEKQELFSKEENLLINFEGIDDCMFMTRNNSNFITGSNCIFCTQDKMNKKKYYTTQEVAKMFKVVYITVYRWIRTNKLEAVKAGGRYRITKEYIERFLLNASEKSNNTR